MEYVKVYQSPHPEFLELTLKDLHQDGVSSARLNPTDERILEVAKIDQQKARKLMKEYNEITLALIDEDTDQIFTIEHEKKFLIGNSPAEESKKIPVEEIKEVNRQPFINFIFALSCFSVIFFPFIIKLEEEKPLTWTAFLSFSLLVLSLIGIFKVNKIYKKENTLKTEKVEDISNFEKKIEISTKLFWPLAFLAIYIFHLKNPGIWGNIIAGNEISQLKTLEFLSFILFIGSSLYLLKQMNKSVFN